MKGRRVLLGIGAFLLLGAFSGSAFSEDAEKRDLQEASGQQKESKVEPRDTLKDVDMSSRFHYNSAGRRDPFQSFIQPGEKKGEGLPPLERVSVDELRLIGVAWSGGRMSAMLQTPDGKTYPIRRGTRVGTNRGRVREIGPRSIIIEEPYLNIFGRTALKQVVMELYTKKESRE